MSKEAKNKAAVRRIMEEYNKGNYDEYFKAFTPDTIFHMGRTQIKGLQVCKGLDLSVRTSFPDGHYTVEDIFAEGDKVAWREAFSGTFTGKFMTFEPTGKRVNLPALVVHRFSGDKIVETWAERDTFDMYQQMSIIPALG